MAFQTIDHQAQALSDSLPALLIKAEKLARSLSQGVHGRRQSGTGEEFWQFKPLQPGHNSERIDWRQSAKRDKLHIQEKEWEAAQKVLFVPLITPSLSYASSSSLPTKHERLVLLTLALCFMLSKTGELFSLAESDLPFAFSQKHIQQIAETMKTDFSINQNKQSFFPIFLGDFLDEPEHLKKTLTSYCQKEQGGLVIQILDPAEENFPFKGPVVFESLDSSSDSSQIEFQKTESIREQYLEKFNQHQREFSGFTQAMGLPLFCHNTGEEPQTVLLKIIDAMKRDHRD